MKLARSPILVIRKDLLRTLPISTNLFSLSFVSVPMWTKENSFQLDIFLLCTYCAKQPQSVTAVLNLLINSVIFFATLALPPLKETRKPPEGLKPFKPSSPPKEVRTTVLSNNWLLKFKMVSELYQWPNPFENVALNPQNTHIHQNSHVYFDFPSLKDLKITPSNEKEKQYFI